MIIITVLITLIRITWRIYIINTYDVYIQNKILCTKKIYFVLINYFLCIN